MIIYSILVFMHFDKIVILSVIILELTCNQSSTKQHTLVNGNKIENQDRFDTIKVVTKTKEEIKTLLADFCTSFNYEVIDLYNSKEKPNENETLILDDYLKDAGFEITSSGRGNWILGSRIVSLTLEKVHCKCEIKKLYYGTGKKIEKVTERITCNAFDGE